MNRKIFSLVALGLAASFTTGCLGVDSENPLGVDSENPFQQSACFENCSPGSVDGNFGKAGVLLEKVFQFLAPGEKKSMKF